MPRNARSSLLETRSNRLKLPVAKKPIFVRVAPLISLGYRRNKTAGTWVLRLANGQGGCTTKKIGYADDYVESDGSNILNFWEAQDCAKIECTGKSDGTDRLDLTVRIAAERYLSSYKARNERSARDAELRLRRLFLPIHGDTPVKDLTRHSLEKWRDSLVRSTRDKEAVRRSQDSANRVLSIVKAVLNHAANDPSNKITDDRAWRLVKPFQRVARSREVHFTTEQMIRLIENTECLAFKKLLKAGYLTGARYGELTSCRICHFDPISETLNVPSGKTGARSILLQPEAVWFFQQISIGRNKEEWLLTRPGGHQWRPSDQIRPMKKALKAAKLDENGTFYALRHSYISRSIEAELPLNIISENCGTSVRMIEKNYAKILLSKKREFIARGAPTLISSE